MTQLLDAHDAVSIEQTTFIATTDHAASICPLCDSHSIVRFEKHNIPIRECSTCRHRFAIPETSSDNHVEHVYGDDYFFSGGGGYDDYLSEAGLLVPHGRLEIGVQNGPTSGS